MAGLTPMFTDRDLERYFDKFQERTEEKIIQTLQYAGEFFVKTARERPKKESFVDITGNLRSSIGYVVVKDGNIISEDFKEAQEGTDKATGVQKSKRLARKLAGEHNKGLVLIGLAGMNYAVNVENIKGKDVISFAEIATNKMLKDLINKTINKR